MQIEEIKKLIKNSMSVLVLDEGKPSFVILDYNVYKELMGEGSMEREVKINHATNTQSLSSVNGNRSRHNFDRESETIERLNKEILALKHRIEAEERSIADQDY